MKKLLLMLLAFTLFAWGGYTDDAYRLFKKGEYQQAYNLYSLAYREEGNIKAAYNIAVMIEKQYVHDRDILNYRPSEAAKWYKIVADSVPETKDLKPEYCAKEMYPYYLKTFNKLSKWYKKGDFVKRSKERADAYKQRAQELQKYCRKYPNYKHSAIPHHQSAEEEYAQAYLKKCPAAKIIPKADRIGIDRYECVYFKRFPSVMKRILNLYQFKRLNDSPTKMTYSEETYSRINKKARKISRPVLSYIIKNEIIPCYKKAKTKSELGRCYDNYLSECQILTFGAIAMCAEPPGGSKESRAKSEDKNLSEKDRKKAIRELKERFKKGDICPMMVMC